MEAIPSVRGETLPGKESKDFELAVGSGVTVLEDGATYVVAEGAAGYASFREGALSVEDPLVVSKDRMLVTACFHPFVGEAGVTRTALEELLGLHGVIFGLDWEAADEALRQVAGSKAPVRDVAIARGQPAVPGRDAKIDFKFKAHKVAGTLIEGTDRIDFKERGTLQVVKQGQLLARKNPPTKGKSGTDVFGVTLPAEAGKDHKLTASGKAEESEDGLCYTASADGVVSLVGDSKIGVCQQYEIPGDVDYGTGNLKMDGSLKIMGWVRTGFTVRATGDILIERGIEDAVVEAGGNLEVHGGILGHEHSRVQAAGDVQAHFVGNGHVRAGGDVAVRDSVMHSQVWARGRMDVTSGRGCIIGGAVSAVKGLVANQLGSDAAVKTRVSAGIEDVIRNRLAAYEREVALYRRNKKKVALSLASLAKQAKRSGAAAMAEKRRAAKLVKWQREGALKEAKLKKYRWALTQALTGKGEPPATVEVKRVVHEGTTVVIHGKPLLVGEDISKKGCFVLDSDDLNVKFLA